MSQTSAAGPNLDGMVLVEGLTFLMGSDAHYPEEKPAHRVAVDSFHIDETTVTNEQFRRFVEETDYLTVAERPVDPANYPGVPPEKLVPSSLVFTPPQRPVDLRDFRNWWSYLAGANWRQPEGPGSSIEGRGEHPVVHVAFEDATAYADWCGKSLPTEAQWELAARGGLEGKAFAWGDTFMPNGQLMAKVWQGNFPWKNLFPAGLEWTAPVRSFPANGYGLHEMTGNVWEWTLDWYSPRHLNGPKTTASDSAASGSAGSSPCCVPFNPRGGPEEQSYDPAVPQVRIPRKVIKGGSFLCAENYCMRYRPAARFPEAVDSATSHLGFRCVVNLPVSPSKA